MTSSPRSDGASTRPIANRDNTIPDVVYHYTDTSALMNIFATRTLWATDIGFMNDPLEYKYGANVLAALLETQLAKEQSNRNRKIEEIPIGNNRTIRMSRTEFMLTAIIERINPPLFPIHERDQEQGISGRFSVSFCDNGDLLSQWRGYAGRDGWAIGFDLSKIVESDFALSAYGISYANDMLSEGANEVANIIMKCITGGVVSLDEICGYAFVRMTHFKHPAFAEEREWRLLIDEDHASRVWHKDQINKFSAKAPKWAGIPKDGLARQGDLIQRDGKPAWSPVRFRTGAVALTPYIPLPFPADAVREVIIGPHPHQDLQRAAVRRLLHQEGLDSSVVIRLSEAPFR